MIRRAIWVVTDAVCVLSLLLCVGVGGLRLQSSRMLMPDVALTKCWIGTRDGSLTLGRYDPTVPPPDFELFDSIRSWRRWSFWGIEVRGFEYHFYLMRDGRTVDLSGREVRTRAHYHSPVNLQTLPIAKGTALVVRPRAIMTALALPPVLWLGTAGRRRFIARRRRQTGRCISCGYDLTGNISGVCPECGAVSMHAKGAA